MKTSLSLKRKKKQQQQNQSMDKLVQLRKKENHWILG